MGLSILIFLAITGCLLGGFHFLPRVWRSDQVKVHKRIASRLHSDRPNDTPKDLYKDPELLNLGSAEEYALAGRDGQSGSWSLIAGLRKPLERQLQRASVPWTANRLLVAVLGLSMGFGVIGAFLLGWLGAAVGIVAGSAAPFVFLHFRVRVRREKVLRQLPSAFELMARVIRSGQAVPQAMQAVAEAFEDPLASMFSDCQQQQSLGLSTEVVLQEMANRSDVLEFRIFVLTMKIQRQTGGNLSEVLERLAAVVRSRLRLRQQVITLTAEGRLQGLTLTLLPLVLFAAMFFINRQYAEVLLDHGYLLAITGVCMGVGLWWTQKIVNADD